MRRTIILGLAAISILGAAGTSAILRLGPGIPAHLVPADAPVPASAAPEPAPPAAPPPVAPPAQEVPAVAPAASGVRPEGERPTVRGRDVYQVLRPFAERIAACVQGEAPHRGATRLLLRLERLRDRLRVVGAEAQPGSPGAQALERCARAEIVGQEVAMHGTTPGPATTLLIPIRP